jgi:hypothetical protein
VTARTTAQEQPGDLPPDNMSRLAIYDALHELSNRNAAGTSEDELFEQVIGRLRMLVPRELHLVGERPYVERKLEACVEAGLVWSSSDNGRRLLGLTGKPPLVRYPDGQLRAYPQGLEAARERLVADNTRLRSAGFDVRRFIPSTADDPDGPEFQALLTSMREHGFMKQFPLVSYADDVVVDGRARLQAATMLEIEVEYAKRLQEAERRRDSPLHRVLVAVNSNLARLSPGVVDEAFARVSAATGRAWSKTAADLALTREWRRSPPAKYSPQFEVEKLSFRKGEDAKVQVTPDEKVMLRSLIEAAGLSSYKIDKLRDYVPFESARTVHSGGPKAIFAQAEDLIAGIFAMQQELAAAKRKVDPEWDQIRAWLLSTFGPPQG